MALKIGPLLDDKPVRVTVELSAHTHRDLAAFADALAAETGQVIEPAKLIGPMLARFMAATVALRRRDGCVERASYQPGAFVLLDFSGPNTLPRPALNNTCRATCAATIAG